MILGKYLYGVFGLLALWFKWRNVFHGMDLQTGLAD